MQKSPKQHPNAQLYMKLMTELKARIDAVQKTGLQVAAKQYPVNIQFAAEFCMLQLRFCCELIAVGTIVIHTDVPQSMKLKTQWNAQRIMDNFDRLKADHFPTPVRDQLRPDLGVSHIAEHYEGCLTKAEMLRMYHFFGEHLHAGTYAKFLKPDSKQHSFKVLNVFTTSLMNLLSVHTYTLYSKERLLRIAMNTPPNGSVAWNEFQRRDDLTAAARQRHQASSKTQK